MADFEWRLYYQDGSVFDSTDGEPHDSPPWGVVAICQPNVDRQVQDQVLCGPNGDWFLYRTDLGYWHMVANVGLIDHLTHFAHLISAVRPGRWDPRNDHYALIWKRAREDADV